MCFWTASLHSSSWLPWLWLQGLAVAHSFVPMFWRLLSQHMVYSFFPQLLLSQGHHALFQLQAFVQKQGINFLLIKGARRAEGKWAGILMNLQHPKPCADTGACTHWTISQAFRGQFRLFGVEHSLGVCGNQPPYLPTIFPTHLSFTFYFLEAHWLLWNLDSLRIKLHGAYAKMCAPSRTLRDLLCLSVVGKVKWTEKENWLTSPWIVGVWFD